MVKSYEPHIGIWGEIARWVYYGQPTVTLTQGKDNWMASVPYRRGDTSKELCKSSFWWSFDIDEEIAYRKVLGAVEANPTNENEKWSK